MIEFLMAIMLYWDAPTMRTDGTPLYSNEISFYEMYHNGEYYDSTKLTEMEVTSYGDYQVRCVDTEGRYSEFGNIVTYQREKGNPSAPGQLRKQR